VELRDVKKIAVFGAGTMGPGLALVFALAGYPVSIYSRKRETLTRARQVMDSALVTLAAHRTIAAEEVETVSARIDATQSLTAAADEADFVLESIVEDKEAKRELFSQLAELCPERTILASNTSSLNIFELLPESIQRRSLCAHFFTPAHIIPLVEVVPGPGTAAEALSLTVALMQACGKSPVVMKRFAPGFIVNRIQRAIGETAMDMIEEGLVDPADIDQAVKASLGVRLPVVGVMQTFDFQGLDMLLAYQKNVDKVYTFVQALVEQGSVGVKAGRGIYDYQGRSETEVLARRDALYLKMLDHLRSLGAFEPV